MSLLRRIGGEPLNSLFRDGLDMILDWYKETPPERDNREFVKLASSVVEFVAKNITKGDTEVIKDNKVRITGLSLRFYHSVYSLRKCFEQCSTRGKVYYWKSHTVYLRRCWTPEAEAIK